MKKKIQKINFNDKRYVLPLILLPFILFIGWKIINFKNDKKEDNIEKKKELSTTLGEVKDSILTKNNAYNQFYKRREKSRSMISNFEEETDSLSYYTETLNLKQKRFIDSLELERKKALTNSAKKIEEKTYYKEKTSLNTNNNSEEDKDFERSLEIIKMLNSDNKSVTASNNTPKNEEKEYDPLKMMKEQMLFIDSLEKANNPQIQEQVEAENRLKADREKMEAFMNSTFNVSKDNSNDNFNHIGRKKPSNLIKAVIDENIKGYLGSRIRLRLLDDVIIGEDIEMPKGTILYALISGFTLQRVNLNIVSVILEGEIYPINLSIYDNDGMKGLYVPRSSFREMMREIGSNTNYMQGSALTSQNQSFYTSLVSGILNSASQTIAKVIRANKVKLKYNSYVYLIDEKELNNKFKNQ